MLCAALRQCSGLTGLTLTRNALGHEGVSALGAMLASCGNNTLSSLQSLDLSGACGRREEAGSVRAAGRRIGCWQGCMQGGPDGRLRQVHNWSTVLLAYGSP